MDQSDPRTHEWYALLMAGVVTIIVSIWKSVFSFRRDMRDAKTNDSRADASISVLDELRSEVQRLSKMVTELSEKLDVESERRRAVENENHSLRLRIAHLEHLIKGSST